MFGDHLLFAGITLLLAEGVLFGILNELPMRPEVTERMRKLLRRLRGVFRTKHAVAIMLALWAAGIGIGMAAYTPPIPKEFFYISYCLLVAAILWSLGVFLSSRFLSNKKIEARKGASYKTWIIGIPLLIVAVGIYMILEIHSVQVGRELLEMNGVLMPADDPDPVGICDQRQLPESALKVYLGGTAAFAEGKSLAIVTLPPPSPQEDYDPVLLGIERAPDGTISLHANIVGKDGKTVARIDRNHFELGRNRLLDPFSSPRKDKSTILLTDEYGNDLQIRFINKHSVSFVGKLYFRPEEYVRIDERGIFAFPGGGGIAKNLCLDFSAPQGTPGLVQVPK